MSKIGVNAGMKILDEGGTAMDAALSVALSEIAETGGKYISYAGIMDVVYYDNKTGKIYNMNASFNTVQNETNPLTIPSVTYNMYDTLQNTVDGRTILVPGFMKGLEEAHKKFGKVPFRKLFENAIEIAEKGTEWTTEDNSNFMRWKNILTKYPETKAVFTKPDGSFYQIGETFKQPELSTTLRKISKEGADYMYKGEWAKEFVNAARNTGSKIMLKDLQDYEVIWTNPVHGTYKGYDLFINGEPDRGGPRLIEALNICRATMVIVWI
jgi:gamma-glutamyltranspeptidase/glutathione hydrolase